MSCDLPTSDLNDSREASGPPKLLSLAKVLLSLLLSLWQENTTSMKGIVSKPRLSKSTFGSKWPESSLMGPHGAC